MRDLRTKKRALALAVGSLSPSSLRHPKQATSPDPGDAVAAAPSLTPSVRSSERELARADRHIGGTNSTDATAADESGGTGTAAASCRSGSSGGVSGNDGGASAFATFASTPEVQKLLSPEEHHHLVQRRCHHHDFKRSASTRNLEGTDGMVGPPRSPSGNRGHGPGGGGNGDAGVVPVSLPANVKVYSGGNIGTCTASSLLLSGETERESAASVFATGESLSDQASRLQPPLRSDGRNTGKSSRKGSGNRSVSYASDSSNSSSSSGKDSSASISGSRGRHRSGRSSRIGGEDGAQGPDKISRSRDDASGLTGHPLPPTASEGCRTVDDMNGSTERGTRAGLSGGGGGSAMIGAGESRAEERSGPAVDPADVVVDEVSVGGTEKEPGSLAARCATDWYRQSKLSAAASGTAR